MSTATTTHPITTDHLPRTTSVISNEESYTVEDLKARGIGPQTIRIMRQKVKPRDFGRARRYLGKEINAYIESLPPAMEGR